MKKILVITLLMCGLCIPAAGQIVPKFICYPTPDAPCPPPSLPPKPVVTPIIQWYGNPTHVAHVDYWANVVLRDEKALQAARTVGNLKRFWSDYALYQRQMHADLHMNAQHYTHVLNTIHSTGANNYPAVCATCAISGNPSVSLQSTITQRGLPAPTARQLMEWDNLWDSVDTGGSGDPSPSDPNPGLVKMDDNTWVYADDPLVDPYTAAIDTLNELVQGIEALPQTTVQVAQAAVQAAIPTPCSVLNEQADISRSMAGLSAVVAMPAWGAAAYIGPVAPVAMSLSSASYYYGSYETSALAAVKGCNGGESSSPLK